MVPATPLKAGDALTVTGLTVAYGAIALQDVAVRFQRGLMTAIVGPNGAGKSTLLKAVLGMVPRVAGEVRVFGEPIAQALPRIAYVPQRASVDWDFPARALDVVLMGMYRQTGLLGRIGAAQKAQAMDCLTRVGMQDYAHRQIGALSGGQQQRVFLARALAQNAELYLLDEPFAGVDAATESAIIGVLKTLRDDGRTIIAVHHDLATVPAYFDRVLLLNRRVIVEGPVATTFRAGPLAETYGSALPTAIPA
ncbi:MAG: metal ABC transporter ATP-binding protein [Pseudomonadota bacterium]